MDVERAPARYKRSASPNESESEDDEEEEPWVESIRTTLDTRVSSDSIGHRLLSKMGWTADSGLGLQGNGRLEPVRIDYEHGTGGLGKQEKDNEVLDNTVFKSREIASIKMSKETQEEREKRESDNARREALEAERKQVLQKFHCDICEKGYKNARQWEEHLNSYDHAHKKRKMERAAEVKSAFATSGELEKRKERERIREEKELKRMGMTAGFAPIVAASTSNLKASADTTSELDGEPLKDGSHATEPITPLFVKPDDTKPRLGGFRKIGQMSTEQSQKEMATVQGIPGLGLLPPSSFPSSSSVDPPKTSLTFSSAPASTKQSSSPQKSTLNVLEGMNDDEEDGLQLGGTKPALKVPKIGFKIGAIKR